MINASIRKDYPLLQNYPALAYLDSAATAQKPARVLQAEQDFHGLLER